MDAKLSRVYYSPKGYWRGESAVKRLAEAAKTLRDVALAWLRKQAAWQIYLPGPVYVPRPAFDEPTPNAVHQADLLYLPHDTAGGKVYRYALTVVDVASHFKAAEPLTDKGAAGVATALTRIYRRGPLRWPKLLQVDPGREFMGGVSQLLAKNGVEVRRGRVDVHRDQGIVERFNWTLAERLFAHQYAREMLQPGVVSREWVKRLPAVVAAINSEATRLTGKKPVEAIRAKVVRSTPAAPARRPVGFEERRLPASAMVRYLYAPGELEGGRRRATDPVWSVSVHRIENVVTKPEDPLLYYVDPSGPRRGFVREELQVVPAGTQQPPA
jgi:hypothetical protein